MVDRVLYSDGGKLETNCGQVANKAVEEGAPSGLIGNQTGGQFWRVSSGRAGVYS